MRMKIPENGACDPIAPLELPHAMHEFKRVSSSDSLNVVHNFFLMSGLCLIYASICLNFKHSYFFSAGGLSHIPWRLLELFQYG
jgi:diacylglycerol kinase (ATP)